MKRLTEFEQLVLLAAARVGDEAYGMAVRDEIRRRTDKAVSLTAVYATLNRLEQAGYVRSWFSPPAPQRGGRAKKHFMVTRAGVTALEEERRLMQGLWKGLRFTAHRRGKLT